MYFFSLLINYEMTKIVTAVKMLCLRWQNFPAIPGILNPDIGHSGCWVKNELSYQLIKKSNQWFKIFP